MAVERIISFNRGQLKNLNHYDIVVRQYDRSETLPWSHEVCIRHNNSYLYSAM